MQEIHYNYMCDRCGSENFPYVDRAYYGNAECTCGGLFERSVIAFPIGLQPKDLKKFIEKIESEGM
jgi:DNA-directed RNA polymerase subunit RPC12/RpoP